MMLNMDNPPGLNDAADTLKELARTSTARSQTAWIARLLPEIEEAIRQGVRLSEIHRALAERGLTLKFRGFEKSLYRCRKARHKAAPAEQRPALPGANAAHPETKSLPALPAAAPQPSPPPPPPAPPRRASAPATPAAESLEALIGPSDGDIARRYFNELRSQGRMPPATTIKEA